MVSDEDIKIALEYAVRIGGAYADGSPIAHEAVDHFLAGIEHERGKHEWISVQERLPESQGEFLIYSTSDPRLNAKSKYLGNACFRVFSGKAFKTGFYIDSTYQPNVTHWMPLPGLPISR